MTKKIKFLKDYYCEVLAFKKDKIYEILEDDECYFSIKDETNIDVPIFKEDYKYEIIEEPESLKTSALDDRIRIMSEYQYIEQQQGHPHAELMARAAEIAKTKIEWWEEFEFKAFDNMWHIMLPNTTFRPSLEYRLKSRTIKIGNREINAPEREKLNCNDHYYIPSIAGEYSTVIWEDDAIDYEYLEKGLVFLDKKDAIAAAEAMIELLKGDE